MGISIKAALAPEWVTPSTQKDDPAPAQFLLVPLPSTVYLNAHAAFQSGNNGDAALMVCEAAVRDWRGVEIDGDGKFSKGLLSRLPPALLAELSTVIIQRATLSETERKNS